VVGLGTILARINLLKHHWNLDVSYAVMLFVSLLFLPQQLVSEVGICTAVSSGPEDDLMTDPPRSIRLLENEERRVKLLSGPGGTRLRS